MWAFSSPIVVDLDSTTCTAMLCDLCPKCHWKQFPHTSSVTTLQDRFSKTNSCAFVSGLNHQISEWLAISTFWKKHWKLAKSFILPLCGHISNHASSNRQLHHATATGCYRIPAQLPHESSQLVWLSLAPLAALAALAPQPHRAALSSRWILRPRSKISTAFPSHVISSRFFSPDFFLSHKISLAIFGELRSKLRFSVWNFKPFRQSTGFVRCQTWSWGNE